jgi:hypothetical protein
VSNHRVAMSAVTSAGCQQPTTQPIRPGGDRHKLPSYTRPWRRLTTLGKRRVPNECMNTPSAQSSPMSGMPNPPPAPRDPWSHAATVLSEVDCTLLYQADGPTDCLFQIHALHDADQEVLTESLEVTPPMAWRVYADPYQNHRFTRLHVMGGEFTVRYRATVRRTVAAFDPTARLVPIAELPDDLLHNLMPTRYCESDVMSRTAYKLFSGVQPGAPQVIAVVDWIHQNIDYQIGSTTNTSTSQDVYMQRAGVCRDFAHLAVTFCRALNIPARLVVGYAPFDEPPPDFHAVFEAYIGDQWVVFDPTRMSPPERLVRIASGRDAKDVAFASLFGPARMLAMAPEIRLLA